MNTQTQPAVECRLDGMVRPGALWDSMRCLELERLEELLNEVAAINNGSNCLGRIARCIELAEFLTRAGFGSGRASFKHFLRERAHEDRFGLDA